jgi:hypothetical protein
MCTTALTVNTTDWSHQTQRTAGLLIQGEWLVTGQTDWVRVYSRTHHQRLLLQNYFSWFDVT